MYVVCVRIAGIEQITSINEYMHYLKFLSKRKRSVCPDSIVKKIFSGR